MSLTFSRCLIRFGVMLIVWAVAPRMTGAQQETSSAKDLFDGKTLTGWKTSDFDDGGAASVATPSNDGRAAIVIEPGKFLSGVTWIDAAALPRMNYEISLEAMRLAGGDFFCGLTFPVGKSAATLIVGGWGGSLVGISSVDDSDASENETATSGEFAMNRWYKIRVRVTADRIEAWSDDKQVIDVETKERKISLRFGEIEKSLPLGLATYQTKAAWRDIRLAQIPNPKLPNAK